MPKFPKLNFKNIKCFHKRFDRRSNTMLGQQAGDGVVARAKLRTVKVNLPFHLTPPI